MPTRESQEVADTDQARETLSRGLLRETRRPQRFELPAPYSLMTLQPGDDIAITHYGGPDSEGDGWGARPFEREHAEIEGVGYDPVTRKFLLGLRDVRNALLRTTWLPGTTRAQLGRIQDGEGIVCASPRFCWRPTVAYVADQLTGVPSQVYYHRPKLTDKGFLIERMRTNIAKSSSFNATHAWGLVGTGVNGSSINAETTRRFFAADPPDGPQLAPTQTLRFGAGNPHAADLYVNANTPLSVTSGNIYPLNVDHVEIAPLVAPSFQLLLAGNYWNVGSQAFQVGPVWNPLSASLSAWTRDHMRFTANATGVVQIRLGYPSGVTALASFVAAHVQLDMGRGAGSFPWASSRIITPDGTEGVSEGDVLLFDNSAGYRLWTASQGTALFTITSLWNTAQVAGFFFTVFKVRYDANNSIELFYDGTNQRFTLRRIAGGVTTDLNSGVVTVTAGTPVTVEVRWAGDYGELNDLYGTPSGSNRWFDMIVNGTRVAGTQSAAPTETAESLLVLGGEEGRQIDGYLKAQITPYVLTENQCAKWRLTS